MNKNISFTIDKNSSNKLEKNFLVEIDTSKLIFKVDINESFLLMTYVIVIDPNGVIRMQKLLGYGEKTFAIGEDNNSTTLGGYPGDICKGKWKIALYVFKEYVYQLLKEDSFKINININISSYLNYKIEDNIGEKSWVDYNLEKNKLTFSNYNWNSVHEDKCRWYKGDFHTHTRLSDGKESVKNAMKKGNDMDLDFYIPTEHNLVHTGWSNTNILAIPGIEVTTPLGHLNVFGLKEIPYNILTILENMDKEDIIQDEVISLLRYNNKKGYINSINHPLLHIWKWKLSEVPLKYINTIEIINDPTYIYANKSNDDAIRLLDTAWNEGYRIYGIGGSDSHNLIDERYDGATKPSIAGDPATYVYCNKLSANEILNNVKEGHMYISRFAKLDINISVDGNIYLPGDKIKNNSNKDLNLSYKIDINLENDEEINVYSVVNGSRKKLKIKKEGNVYKVDFNYMIPKDKYSWIRVEVRNREDEFIAYANPIYYGEKKTNVATYGELIKEMRNYNEN